MKVTGKHSVRLNFVVDEDYKKHQKELIQKCRSGEFGSEWGSFSDDVDPFPTQEDIVAFPVRHLSKTIVGGNSWKATDFTKGNVLKNSKSLLEGKPIFLNHELRVGNEVGVVGKLKFREGYKNSKDEMIPAGIEGPILIDKVLEPRLVRKMSGPLPSVKSVSVTVFFNWEASHEFESEWDFYEKLGTIVDGEMVTRIATKITDYAETSLVWLGADPYAGLLDEKGDAQVRDKRNINFVSLSEEPEVIRNMYNDQSKYVVSLCLGSDNLLSLGSSHTKNINHRQMDLQKFLAEKLNCKTEEVDEKMLQGFSFVKSEDLTTMKSKADKFDENKEAIEGYEAKVGEVKSLSTKVSGLESDIKAKDESITSLTSEKQTLVLKVEENKEKVTGFENVISQRQDYAISLYKKSLPEGVSEDKNIIDELKAETSLEKLESKVNFMGGKTLEKFKASCSDCDSENISFKSSVHIDEGTREEESATGVSLGEMAMINRG